MYLYIDLKIQTLLTIYSNQMCFLDSMKYIYLNVFTVYMFYNMIMIREYNI